MMRIKKLIVAQNGHEFLLDIIKQPPRDVNLAKEVCFCVKNISSIESLKLKFSGLGGAPRLLAVLMQYNNNKELVEYAKSGLQNLSSLNGDKKKMWLNDENAKICCDCKGSFDLIKRRHHCRFCGRVFCEACSSKKTALTLFNYDTAVRVCSTCFLLLDRYQKQLLGTEDNVLRISVNSISPPTSPPASPTSTVSTNYFGSNSAAPVLKKSISDKGFIRANSKTNMQ